ncbi:hypothetical protein L2E82_12078 [Cichorium intybus]|uniref:Uncharacterized protein n=1 Tax=Cichorium intybus TaxID=13427 RepID=A0ACB9GFS6_CICIN|nr:hypothetical protein L2E82_12078 [Cichorium intybus]
MRVLTSLAVSSHSFFLLPRVSFLQVKWECVIWVLLILCIFHVDGNCEAWKTGEGAEKMDTWRLGYTSINLNTPLKSCNILMTSYTTQHLHLHILYCSYPFFSSLASCNIKQIQNGKICKMKNKRYKIDGSYPPAGTHLKHTITTDQCNISIIFDMGFDKQILLKSYPSHTSQKIIKSKKNFQVR